VKKEIQAQIPLHQNFHNGQNKQAPFQQNNLPKQKIIFDEVGKLASNLKYIHVAIPLNITTFYEQGLILEPISKIWQTPQLPKFAVYLSLKQPETQEYGDSEDCRRL
jgi:hypothetical protein